VNSGFWRSAGSVALPSCCPRTGSADRIQALAEDLGNSAIAIVFFGEGACMCASKRASMTSALLAKRRVLTDENG
jgi:hypothetical protein